MLADIQYQIDTTSIIEQRTFLQEKDLTRSKEEVESGRISSSDLMQAKLALLISKQNLMTERAKLLMQLSDYMDLVEPAGK
jgi:SAM-dependent MidA family methyltransferase